MEASDFFAKVLPKNELFGIFSWRGANKNLGFRIPAIPGRKGGGEMELPTAAILDNILKFQNSRKLFTPTLSTPTKMLL